MDKASKKLVKTSIFTSLALICVLYFVWMIVVFAKPPFDDLQDWQQTDFSQTTLPLNEIVEGGPGKDGIQSIDEPEFETIAQAQTWLADREPVVAFTHAGEARAYPLQILMYHELVNDNVVDQPIAVTYCPLCNAAMVFSRRYQQQILQFGISGKIYNSNMVMYDRQSESWWLQFTGEGIVGEYAGAELQLLPSQLVSFAHYLKAYPKGKVLARPAGMNKKYGVNPYARYDSKHLPVVWFYRKPFDDRLPAMQRVLGVAINEHAVAFPLTQLKQQALLQVDIADQPILIVSKPGMASAVDKKLIKNSKDVLAAVAFARNLEGQQLNFQIIDNEIVDMQTNSVWNMFGQAVSGKLQGKKLKQLDRGVYFSFVWLDFYPDSIIYNSEI